jgi:Ran GTPase-activating protein (RanGAP) involved in mRNA processing and transport
MNLQKNKIGDKGAQAIAEALMTNSSLQVLDLSQNCIHKKGAKYLAKALPLNNSLRELKIETF